jgi:hypothetical protein
VRIARQRMPRFPRVVAARPNPSAGELLEGREGPGAWPVGPCERVGGSPGVRRDGATGSGRAAGRRKEETEEGKSGAGRMEKGEAPTCGVGRPVREKRGRGLRGGLGQGTAHAGGKKREGALGLRERKKRGKEARGRKESGPAWPMREEGGERESWAG